MADVQIARSVPYACSEPGQQSIREDILEQNLDRVVVASCSPRLHEPTFRQMVQDAGLNPYILEMANLREHCSWVHMDQPEAATEKAMDLTRMAVSRVRSHKAAGAGKTAPGQTDPGHRRRCGRNSGGAGSCRQRV